MDEREELTTWIKEWRSHRHDGQRRWSGLHHFCLFGSVVSSLSAGAILQLFPQRTDLSTILTSLAAILTGAAASGGFGRKWQINRLSRCRADLLLIELTSPHADLAAIRKGLQDAMLQHDIEIVGEKPQSDSTPIP